MQALPATNIRVQRDDALMQALGAELYDILRPSDFENLAKIASMRQGGSRLTNVIRWLRAIHANRELHQNSEDPIKEPERWFIKLMTEYRGRIDLLRNFCTLLECADPILAARSVQLNLPGSQPLPKAVLEEVPDMRVGHNGKSRTAVKGAGGTMLVGDVYWAENKNAPGSLGFFACIRATMRIMEAFGGARHQQANLEVVRKRRDNTLLNVLRQSISLEDIIANPQLSKTIGSPLVARKLQVYQELAPLVEQLRSDLNLALYANSIFGIAAKQAQLLDDPGGQLRTWFSRQKDLPAAVSNAVAEYYDPHLDFSPEREEANSRIMVAYYRAHVQVSNHVILDPIKRDLEALRGLSKDDPIRQKYEPLIAAGFPLVGELLKSQDGTTSLSQISTLLQTIPLDQMRLEINSALYAHFEQEILRARSRVKKLFSEKNKWNDDLYQDAIPMARLKETVYGQPLGSSESVLGYHDFEAIKRMLVAGVIVPKRDDFLRSLEVSEFKKLLEDFLKASRKMIHFDNILQVLARGDVPRYQPVNRRDLILQERFSAALPYSEIIARVNDRKLWPRRARVRAEIIASEARAGLMSPSGIQVAKDCVAKVKNLSPRGEHRELLKAARRVAGSTLVRPIWSKLNDTVGYSYFTPDEVANLQLIADSEQIVNAKLSAGDKSLAEKRVQSMERYSYLSISDFAGKFSLTRKKFSQICPPERIDPLDIYTPDAVERAFKLIKNEFIKVNRLTAEQKKLVEKYIKPSEVKDSDCISKATIERLVQRG